MDKEYWQTRWQNRQIEFDQKAPNPLLVKYIKKLNLKQNAKVFVPLCGKSIDMLWLAEQGYKVIGNELNLDACREFFTQHGLSYQEEIREKFHVLTSENITLLSGDYFELDQKILGDIDAVYDRAALIALPGGKRQQYVNHLKDLKTAHTQILLITYHYNQNEMNGPPFSVDENEVNLLYANEFKVSCINKERIDIPAHLKAKGLKEVLYLTFLLT